MAGLDVSIFRSPFAYSSWLVRITSSPRDPSWANTHRFRFCLPEVPLLRGLCACTTRIWLRCAARSACDKCCAQADKRLPHIVAQRCATLQSPSAKARTPPSHLLRRCCRGPALLRQQHGRGLAYIPVCMAAQTLDSEDAVRHARRLLRASQEAAQRPAPDPTPPEEGARTSRAVRGLPLACCDVGHAH